MSTDLLSPCGSATRCEPKYDSARKQHEEIRIRGASERQSADLWGRFDVGAGPQGSPSIVADVSVMYTEPRYPWRGGAARLSHWDGSQGRLRRPSA